MNDSAPVLALTRASRRLSGRLIVEEVGFRVGRGEVLGLLGINGAGKSTTLRMIAGLLAPDAGDVRINGADPYAQPALLRREVGYLPEDAPLYAELTVSEYLDFCARLRGLRGNAAAAAVSRAIERCDLGEMRRRLCGLLSKGWRQRVGLAQAILHEPSLIVLDEPASGLDPVQALRLRELIARLREAHAVVLSTHVLSDVIACCDTVAILHQGRVHHHGALVDLDARAALRVRVERALDASDWLGVPGVASAHALDPHTWRITLDEGSDSADLAAASARLGFGLQELRTDASALEAVFLRISAAQAPAGRAA